MNSLQIQYFLTVAELNNFTEAANRLFVSQPAVSKQIRLLEQELGQTLFDRSGKTIRLTVPGQAYYDYFMQCRFHLDLLQNRLMEQQETGRVSIRIAYLEGLDPAHFLASMEEAAAKVGSLVRLQTSCYALPQLLEALQNGLADLILTFGSVLTQKSFLAEPLAQVPRVLLYSARRFPEHVHDLSTFRHEIFYLPEDAHTSSMEQTLHEIFLNYGYAPRIRYAPNFPTIMDRVEHGDGVFVYNAWCRYCQAPAFGCLPLSDTQTLYLTGKDGAAAPEIHQFSMVLKELMKGRS